MNKKFISIALVSTFLTTATHTAYADDKKKQYIGTGIGATAGALVAGPVGFVVGGVIGNLAGRHDGLDDDNAPAPADEVINTEPALALSTEFAVQDNSADPATEALADDFDVAAYTGTANDSSDLMDIIVSGTQLDIYFLSGSTEIETFYQPRIQAISDLVQAAPGLDIHLEGYADRRGDKDTNLELSNARLDSVRNQLIQTGIDASRIHVRAFGEQGFNSRPGNLEAYTFDRRVVIRLEHRVSAEKSPVALIKKQQAL